MKKSIVLLFILSFFLFSFVGIGSVYAIDNNKLLEKLIEKGIITREEAEEIKEEEQKAEEQRQEKIVKAVEEKELAIPKALKGLKVGMLAYIDYSYGDEPESNNGESSLNRFKLTRGYLTVEKEILPWFHTRITLDTHEDNEEDWKMRLKYLYAELRPPDLGFLTNMKSEIGMGHMPWLDFEEHINPYRCQGTMAIERAGTFNSADLGVSLRGNFAGRLEQAEEITGNHHYDGRYGGWHLGVYNGPGYHETEENTNKVIEGRLTLRPLPDVIPGLKLSYFGLYGEGDNDTNPAGEYPDYEVNLGMLSYQNPWLIMTGQYFLTKGNSKGSWFDAQGDALDTKGYSMFGSVKLPILDRKLSLLARYDHFDQ
ncbi:MAG: hypothetical protein JRF34_04370, partial [Deltaproteobacteria bacterium]|nr:hypothetical protein [Deltaproteobacteria bacterium]